MVCGAIASLFRLILFELFLSLTEPSQRSARPLNCAEVEHSHRRRKFLVLLSKYAVLDRAKRYTFVGQEYAVDVYFLLRMGKE